MERKINENSLVCIEKKNHLFEISYIPFSSNPLLVDDDYLFIKRLINSKDIKDWTYIRDNGFTSYERLRRKYSKYFVKNDLCLDPAEAFSEMATIGQNTVITKLSRKQDQSNAKYKNEGNGSLYTLSKLVEKIEDTFLAYLYTEAIEKAKNQKVLAYSHRIVGWNSSVFPLDSNFKLVIDSNFGYGYSSYFLIVLLYKNIKIVPFSVLINYLYARMESYLHYTYKLYVRYESFVPAFEFVVNACNEFNASNSGFIYKYIIAELDKLTIGLENLLFNSRFNAYLTYNVSFLNEAGTNKVEIVFPRYEINILRTRKALEVNGLKDSIASLDGILDGKSYLNTINMYRINVHEQNKIMIDNLKRDILAGWKRINVFGMDIEIERISFVQKVGVFFKKYMDVKVDKDQYLIPSYMQNNAKRLLLNYKYHSSFWKLHEYVQDKLFAYTEQIDPDYFQIFINEEDVEKYMEYSKHLCEAIIRKHPLSCQNNSAEKEALFHKMAVESIAKMGPSRNRVEDFDVYYSNLNDLLRKIKREENDPILGEIIENVESTRNSIIDDFEVVKGLYGYFEVARDSESTEPLMLQIYGIISKTAYENSYKNIEYLENITAFVRGLVNRCKQGEHGEGLARDLVGLVEESVELNTRLVNENRQIDKANVIEPYDQYKYILDRITPNSNTITFQYISSLTSNTKLFFTCADDLQNLIGTHLLRISETGKRLIDFEIYSKSIELLKELDQMDKSLGKTL